jgi:hypothetical protein
MRGGGNGMNDLLQSERTWTTEEVLPVSVAHRHFFSVVVLTLLENSFTQLLSAELLTPGCKRLPGESHNSKC